MPETGQTVEFAGVRLSSPDKILFPEQGVSKRDLAGYLVEMANHILPDLSRRPLSLVRCPDGYEDGCFFQKHGASGFPEEIKRVSIREKSGKKADYLYIDDVTGLAAAAQRGVIELHIWGAHIDDIEKPDRMVFDLDPAEDVSFAQVKQAAQDVRNTLSAAGLESFPLLTGGKGIHVVVPLERQQSWDTVKQFASGLARMLSSLEPDRFIAKSAKADRRGRIFIDWLRNERGATAVAPYSPRARKGAPVAVPVNWGELSRIDSANKYKMDNVRARMKRLKNNPWNGYNEARQSINADALESIEWSAKRN